MNIDCVVQLSILDRPVKEAKNLDHMYFFINANRLWHSLPCTILRRFLHSDTRVVMACDVSGANFRANRGHCGPRVAEYSGTSMLHVLKFNASCLMN